MKHEDFTTLALDDVLTKVLQYCQIVTGAPGVHWVSALGLTRVQESSRENWQWAFAAADVVGNHMWSVPATDAFSLFQLWKQVEQLFPPPWRERLSAKVLVGPVSRLVQPVYSDHRFLGVLVLDGPKDQDPMAMAVKIAPGLAIGSRYLRFAYDYLAAQNESFLDELTGLHNQRYLPIVLEHEISRAKREGTPFTLLFLDIDYFKMVNDGRGHWVGSRLLVELGKVLKGQVRACDYCFRYGGDEFIVLLGNAGSDDAVRVAERIRKSIEEKTFTVEGHNLNLTVSIGLASYPQHAQTAAGLIQIADQAMYYGKRKSRNIVFVAS